MKMLKRLAVVFALGLGMTQTAIADDEFYGVLKKRPSGKVGTWVVNGQAFKVTKKTELDSDHGPLKVGACVQVDIDDGQVESIETEPVYKCPKLNKNHALNTRTAHPAHDFYGVIKHRPKGKAGTWVIGKHKVKVSRYTELDSDHGPLKVGACVQVDIDDGQVESIETEPKKKCHY